MIAIHFKCGKCGKHLEADQSGAGMVIQCLDCSTPLMVPPATAKHTCPHCNVAVLVADNLKGDTFECSTCLNPFHIPGPNDPIPHDFPKIAIHFKCGKCGKHLEADQSGAGMIIQCLDCSTPLMVPPATAKHTCPHCNVPVLVADNLKGDTFECSTCCNPFHIQDSDDPIRHACPFCYTVVLFDNSMKGQFIECPTCQKPFLIPNLDRDHKNSSSSPAKGSNTNSSNGIGHLDKNIPGHDQYYYF